MPVSDQNKKPSPKSSVDSLGTLSNSTPSGDSTAGNSLEEWEAETKDPSGKTDDATGDALVAGAQTVANVAGAFELQDEKTGAAFAGDKFNLKPRENRKGPTPEDQRKIARQTYAVRNTLKLLHAQPKSQLFKRLIAGRLIPDDGYHEFISRVKQAALVGCTGNNVDTALAASALEDISTDIVRRYGRAIVHRYLALMGLWASIGIALGWIAIGVSYPLELPVIWGYGYLVMGAMVGAWLSAATTRREITLEGLQEFVNMSTEPVVRLVFVGLLAAVFAMFIQLKIVSIVTIGDIDLAQFFTRAEWALALGIVAGISERALSKKLVRSAGKAFGNER